MIGNKNTRSSIASKQNTSTQPVTSNTSVPTNQNTSTQPVTSNNSLPTNQNTSTQPATSNNSVSTNQNIETNNSVPVNKNTSTIDLDVEIPNYTQQLKNVSNAAIQNVKMVAGKFISQQWNDFKNTLKKMSIGIDTTSNTQNVSQTGGKRKTRKPKKNRKKNQKT